MIRSLLVTMLLLLGVLVPPGPDVHAASTLLESTFAASAHHVISDQAALLSSLAPRWRTNIVVTPNDPGRDNAANLGSQLPVLGNSAHWRPMVHLLAHEMTHALGAVSGESPHFNAENPSHPSDCFDILCYAGPTPGQSYLTACGFRDSTQSWYRGRGSWRQDCDDDDYFAADNPPGRRSAGLPGSSQAARRHAR